MAWGERFLRTLPCKLCGAHIIAACSSGGFVGTNFQAQFSSHIRNSSLEVDFSYPRKLFVCVNNLFINGERYHVTYPTFDTPFARAGNGK